MITVMVQVWSYVDRIKKQCFDGSYCTNSGRPGKTIICVRNYIN